MSADQQTERVARVRIRDEEGTLDPGFVAKVSDAIKAHDGEALRVLVGDLHESDLGDVLHALDPKERDRLVRLMGHHFDWVALTEVDDTVRDEILESIPNEQIAEALRELDSDDAIEIIANLDEEDREEVLAGLPLAERIALQRSLDYPEDSAGRRMTRRISSRCRRSGPSARRSTSCARTSACRTSSPSSTSSIRASAFSARSRSTGCFAPSGRRTIERHRRRSRAFGAGDRRPGGRGAPVRALQPSVRRRASTMTGRLVGVITIDDIVDIIEEEADEDIKRLAGVGDEEISDRRRLRRAAAARLAARQSRHGVPRRLGHRTFRRHASSEIVVARHAVADRRRRGRQCRHADADRDGARARDARARRRSITLAAHRPRGAGRHLQRRAARLHHRHPGRGL